MTYYTLEDAQNQLHKLIASALRGEKIIIKVDENEAVQLVPSKKSRKPCKPGSAKGLIKMSDDFDDPLDDFKVYME